MDTNESEAEENTNTSKEHDYFRAAPQQWNHIPQRKANYGHCPYNNDYPRPGSS